MLRRLPTRPSDLEPIESLLDAHLWIVEEELRICIGSPPWFDSALAFLLAETVRDLGPFKPRKKWAAHLIRRKARQAADELERTLAERHVQDGIVKFTVCESFKAVVGSVLERQRSLYWEELRLPKSFSSRYGPPGGTD